MTRTLLHLVPFCAALALAAPSASAQQPESDGIVVLTGLAPVQALVSELVQGTSITVQPITPRPAPMTTLTAMLGRADPERQDLIDDADAVITLSGLWSADPLYATVRAGNIWVVEIDATRALDGTRAPIARVGAPASDPVWRQAEDTSGSASASLYPWMGPTTAIAMGEIMAHDLIRMAPDDAAAIDANLEALRADVRRLKAEYEARFATLADFTVYALTDQFAYLTNEFGLFVDGYFLEQDVRWTEEDFAGLTAHLEERGIATVIHQWQPDDAVTAAVEAAGAELVILSSGETMQAETDDAYIAMLRANLDALYEALADAPQ